MPFAPSSVLLAFGAMVVPVPVSGSVGSGNRAERCFRVSAGGRWFLSHALQVQLDLI